MVNKIKQARMDAEKKQVQLSRETGIHSSILSQLENGWRNPTPDQLKKLKRALPNLGEVAA